MIIEPKIKGFLCTTAHPTGCFRDVEQQIDYVRKRSAIDSGPARVLVIGASGGYGLATRISAAWGRSADTIGVFLERPAKANRTATAGWYRAAAFEQLNADQNRLSLSINGDAYSDEVKQLTADSIRKHIGQVDLVVYSLASPVRQMPDSGELVRSALKPIGKPFKGLTIDVKSGQLREISADAATQEEIDQTVKVMGGDDWQRWLKVLLDQDCLAEGVQTLTYTYIGSEVTWPIYHHGTIGRAKEDLDRAAVELNGMLADLNGTATVAVMKGLLTQASSAIPGMPLYLSLLFKAMKDQNVHEGCIEQTDRLFRDRLVLPPEQQLEEDQRIHMDELEMAESVQAWVREHWSLINESNLRSLTDFQGYQQGFFNLYGFGFPGVDYAADIELEVPLTTQ